MTEETALDVDIRYIKDDVKEIKRRLDEKYVTHDEFAPVKKIVYGLVAVVLLGAMGAMLSLIFI